MSVGYHTVITPSTHTGAPQPPSPPKHTHTHTQYFERPLLVWASYPALTTHPQLAISVTYTNIHCYLSYFYKHCYCHLLNSILLSQNTPLVPGWCGVDNRTWRCVAASVHSCRGGARGVVGEGHAHGGWVSADGGQHVVRLARGEVDKDVLLMVEGGEEQGVGVHVSARG
jgi:hypothetical protein